MFILDNVLPVILADEKIEYFGMIPFSSCKIINPSLYERKVDFKPKTAIMLAVPYYTGKHEKRNISLYAVSKDYHLFFRGLFFRLEAKLTEMFPDSRFASFADSSPINETGSACRAGLGVIGDKGQLITKDYGSHVFIGEILTDIIPEKYTESEIAFCSHCGKCKKYCPTGEGECFSSLTQKKGELDDKTKELIKATGCVWGCDICREKCPMNADIKTTPIPFFYEDNIEVLTSDVLDKMSKEEFAKRAYSFRGINTVKRNVVYFENRDK